MLGTEQGDNTYTYISLNLGLRKIASWNGAINGYKAFIRSIDYTRYTHILPSVFIIINWKNSSRWIKADWRAMMEDSNTPSNCGLHRT